MRSLAVRLSQLGHLILIVFAHGCRDPATASFEETIPDIVGGDSDLYTLTTNVTPEGAGTVIPASGEFSEGSEVEVKAEPSGSWYFTGWEGDLEGTANPETLFIDGDKTITAVFELFTNSPSIAIVQQPGRT